MKYALLFIFLVLLTISGFSQPERQEIVGIGYVEIKFKDSSEVYVMMWDDFTFEFNENHSEISIVEGGSNDKQTIKAKRIDYIHFLVDSSRIELHRYKSPRGRDHLLLNLVHQNGEYMILQSPSFAQPVYYYIGFQGEVFSLLPQNNLDFIQFFSCEYLQTEYGLVENYALDLPMMVDRLDLYLSQCLLSPVTEKDGKKKK